MFSPIMCCVSVEKGQPHPRSGEIWEQERIAYFVPASENHEPFDIAGEPVVFEWTLHPGHTTAQLFGEVQKMMNDDEVHPSP